MAVEADLIFESFLKKRKDKMKFTWVKYWFRLHNTTLYFFTKKHGDALRLHGHYSMYIVQSVREAQAVKADYPFEITMTKGKKKLLSAESADLRTAWIEILWKSMQLPGPGREQSACTWHDVPTLMERAQVARDHKEENHYNTVLYVEETISCISRATDLLILEETKKTTDFHTSNVNEDRESAIYETLKVETIEDKPSDERGEYSGDIKAVTAGNVGKLVEMLKSSMEQLVALLLLRRAHRVIHVLLSTALPQQRMNSCPELFRRNHWLLRKEKSINVKRAAPIHP